MILDSPVGGDPPTCRAIAKKRLIGFEPTTFCMAISEVIRRTSVLNQPTCRAFVMDEIGDIQRGYARIGVDMQRVRHFSPEVPEIEETGSSSPCLSPTMR